MLRTLLNSTLSSGFWKLYQRAWAVFNEFYRQFYHSGDPILPLTIPSLALFISYLHAHKFAPPTIKSYLSVIGCVHKMSGLCDPIKAFLISKLLTALGRQGSSNSRLPISQPVLHKLVGSLSHTNSSVFIVHCSRRCSYQHFMAFFELGS